jgi:hypothetical protein
MSRESRTVFFVPFVSEGVEVGMHGHGLMKSGIENSYMGDAGQEFPPGYPREET